MKLKIPEVAKRLGRPYTTVLAMVKRGDIKGVRYGKLWLVTEEEIERFKREGNVNRKD